MTLEKALSYIAQMKNKKTITHKSLKGILTYQLKWFKPKQAEKFIKKAKQKGYLKKQNNHLKIQTKKEHNLNINYKPKINLDNIETKKTQNPVNKMAEHIAQNSEQNFKEVISGMNKKYSQMGKSVDFLITAYLYGEEKNIDMSKYTDLIDY